MRFTWGLPFIKTPHQKKLVIDEFDKVRGQGAYEEYYYNEFQLEGRWMYKKIQKYLTYQSRIGKKNAKGCAIFATSEQFLGKSAKIDYDEERSYEFVTKRYQNFMSEYVYCKLTEVLWPVWFLFGWSLHSKKERVIVYNPSDSEISDDCENITAYEKWNRGQKHHHYTNQVPMNPYIFKSPHHKIKLQPFEIGKRKLKNGWKPENRNLLRLMNELFKLSLDSFRSRPFCKRQTNRDWKRYDKMRNNNRPPKWNKLSNYERDEIFYLRRLMPNLSSWEYKYLLNINKWSEINRYLKNTQEKFDKLETQVCVDMRKFIKNEIWTRVKLFNHIVKKQNIPYLSVYNDRYARKELTFWNTLINVSILNNEEIMLKMDAEFHFINEENF